MRARRTCSCARGRPGPSSRSSWPRTERRATTSASRCRSPGTRWWSGRTLTTPGRRRMRARRTCSCARGRPGPSSRSSWRRTERRATTSATRCRSPGTRWWSGRSPTTPRAARMRARRTCSCARGRSGPSSRSSLASDGAAGDHFGYSVSVSGDTVVVGASLHDTPGGVDAGSAYVFVRSGTTWTEQQKLLASDGAAGDDFGFSVSVSGDTVVVGAPLDDTRGRRGCGLGVRVRALGDDLDRAAEAPGARTERRATTSATRCRSPGTRWWSGRPRTTPRAAWMRARRTCSCARGRPGPSSRSSLASDGAADDSFGFSVSVSGDTVVVGAPLRRHAGRRGCGLGVRVRALGHDLDRAAEAHGVGRSARATTSATSVSVSGDTVVVGAPRHDTPGGVDAGSAYVFVRSGTTWTEQQKLLASDGAAGDLLRLRRCRSPGTRWWSGRTSTTPGRRGCGLGVRVRALGHDLDRAAEAPGVGRSGERRTSAARCRSPGTRWWSGRTGRHAGRRDAGSAYVFVRSGTTWTEQQKLLASDGAAGDHFGSSVSVSGDTVVVGAPGDDTPGGVDAGSAYVFVRSGTTWTEQQKLLAPDGAADDDFGISVSVSGDTVGGRGARGRHRRAAWMRARRTCSGRSRPTCRSPRRTARRRRCRAQPVTYTITVANAGPTVATGATVTDSGAGRAAWARRGPARLRRDRAARPAARATSTTPSTCSSAGPRPTR